MTNEEIERIATKAILAIDDEMREAKALGYIWTRELMLKTVCEAAAQAYEEAAVELDKYRHEFEASDHEEATAIVWLLGSAAGRIRALKDKLAASVAR